MTDDQAERMEFAGASEQLHEGFGKIAARLKDHPEQVRKLSDRTLLALAVWTEGSEDNHVATAECRRRRAEHVAKAARFGAFGGQPEETTRDWYIREVAFAVDAHEMTAELEAELDAITAELGNTEQSYARAAQLIACRRNTCGGPAAGHDHIA